jgi:hypothetical protein
MKFKITALGLNNLKPNMDSCLSEIDRIYIDGEIELPAWNWSKIQLKEN